MKSPPTIRQLASLAGLSRTTVSLALRNHPSIPEETRLRIVKLAEENGYRPDPLVSTLMNQLRTARRSRVTEKLAYLTWWNSEEEWKISSNDVNFFEGAKERAARLGYEIEHIWAKEPRMTAARLCKILYTRAIRGVCLGPLLRSRGHISLDWRHFAGAAISNTVVKPDLHRASHSHYQGMLLVLRTLRHHGYNRVGFFNLIDQVERVNYGWLASYLTYEHGRKAKTRIPPLLQRHWDQKEFVIWMDKYKPQAIVCNMQTPLEMLSAAGYRVPEDVGYACLDRLREGDPWAGIDQRPRAVAAAAIDLVVGQLQNNEFGLSPCPKTVMIDGVWCDGSTILHRHG